MTRELERVEVPADAAPPTDARDAAALDAGTDDWFGSGGGDPGGVPIY